MFKHIGSFVFAAMTLVIFTLSRFLSHAQPSQNTSNKPVIVWERVLIACLTKSMEQTVNYMNHYSIIVLQLTGKPYTECGKLACGMMYRYKKLKWYTSVISKFILVWGLIFAILVPIIVVYFSLKAYYPPFTSQ